ncbi:hypothetical protein CB740_22130 [Salmonella enterica subsp. enterica serovar Enteritidis]|nr:hypothetical protein [Salmonella enterica subsp. enterica serovar Enteritidis]
MEVRRFLYDADHPGRMTEKTDRIPGGVVIRMNDERTHRYEYDNQHRLVHYVRTQHNSVLAEGRYLYDPLGRRVGKRVWTRELVHWSDTRMELSRRPYVTWYGWEGDRLTTIQTGQGRVQTVYAPGSFTPLVRIETDAAEQAKAQHRSLAEKLSQEGSEDGQAVQLPAALTAMLDRLEGELRRNTVSEESRQWLAGCGLTPEQMAGQLEPEYTPQRKIHLYHCDQRGLPLALVTPDNTVAWRGEYDEWGNLSGEENPADLEQVIRLPGQQYDEESGLYYNRHRYYNPGQGRYITQDPIGLKGGWNLYQYPLNPVVNIDPLGLWQDDSMEQSGPSWFIADPMEKYRQQAAIDLTKWWNDTAPQRTFSSLMMNPAGLALLVCAAQSSGESRRCAKVKEKCHDQCADIFADTPDLLPGSGRDLAGRLRRCIRECIEDHGCRAGTTS